MRAVAIVATPLTIALGALVCVVHANDQGLGSGDDAEAVIRRLGGIVYHDQARGRVVEVKLNGAEALTDDDLRYVARFGALTDLLCTRRPRFREY